MKGYSITQLHPEQQFERHVFGRDLFAHYLRWSHVLKIAKKGDKILDFGCGSGNLYNVLYANRHEAEYTGLDIRKQTIEKNKQKFPRAKFFQEDIVKMGNHYGTDWDFITSFEVCEHVCKTNVPKLLDNIKSHCGPNTTVLISTPCYDERVGAAEDHTYDGGDGRGRQPQELTYQEMLNLISERFEIIERYGTFASQRDYKHILSPAEKEVFDKLSKYYDPVLVSVIFAPLVPEHSRNVIWKLKAK